MVTWKYIIEGAYTLIDDESDIGNLMHDFNCTQASDMVFPLMAEKTKYLKENPKRRKHYVIKYIDKNDSLCLKILKGDERLAKELQDGNQSYSGAEDEDQ